VDVQFTVGDGVAETNVTELLEHLSTPTAYDAYETTEEVQYKPFSQYPFIARDIALWVAEGTLVDDVADLLKSEAGPLCVRMTLFDEFSKEGRTSYAFRLVFQSDSRTLTDGEVNTLMEKIVDMVAKKGWEVR
jgi:phenylalanyl-tRNA synthetase beta chain